MDWPKAKAYLIAAFLLLDIFLAVRFRPDAYRDLPVVLPVRASPEARTKERLAEKGIVLLGPISARQNEPMRNLVVRFADPRADRLAAALLQNPQGAGVTRLPGPPAGVLFESEKESLTVVEDGLMLYDRRNLQAIRQVRPLDPKGARSDAEDLVRRIAGLWPAVEFDAIWPAGSDPPVYRVLFTQKYEGRPVFAGYLGVEVGADGVRSVRGLALRPERPAGEPRTPRTAEEALTALRSALAGRGSLPEGEKLVIARADLGYYGRIPKDWAKEWELSPVWRFVTKDGQVFYISAFAGEGEVLLPEESPPPT